MSATDRIARIIVNLALDQTFDYRVPEDLAGKVQVGSKVTIPFGKSSRDGYVVALLETSEFDDLKEVQAVVGDRPLIPEKLLALGQWIADYYCCSREQATHALLPSVVRGGRVSPKKQKFVRLADDIDVATALEKLGTRAPRQADVLRPEQLNVMVPRPRLGARQRRPAAGAALPAAPHALVALAVLLADLDGLAPGQRDVPHDLREPVEADGLGRHGLDGTAGHRDAMSAHEQHVAIAHGIDHIRALLLVHHRR